MASKPRRGLRSSAQSDCCDAKSGAGRQIFFVRRQRLPRCIASASLAPPAVTRPQARATHRVRETSEKKHFRENADARTGCESEVERARKADPGMPSPAWPQASPGKILRRGC
jgi:hypothetical protein